MRSRANAAYWKLFNALPPEIQQAAKTAFDIFDRNPFHPSLQFKEIDAKEGVWSARVGLRFRAMCIRRGSELTWIWIGSHSDYDNRT